MSVSPSSGLQERGRGRRYGGPEAGPTGPLQVIGFGLGSISQFKGSQNGFYGQFLKARGSWLAEIRLNFLQFNPIDMKLSRKRPRIFYH
jgi:hypothetical protein